VGAARRLLHLRLDLLLIKILRLKLRPLLRFPLFLLKLRLPLLLKARLLLLGMALLGLLSSERIRGRGALPAFAEPERRRAVIWSSQNGVCCGGQRRQRSGDARKAEA
jgi:hypothetical protein